MLKKYPPTDQKHINYLGIKITEVPFLQNFIIYIWMNARTEILGTHLGT